MSIIILTGASLGANNCPVIARALRGHRDIDVMCGFQASEYGAKVSITSNVKVAYEAVSDNPLNLGLGSYRWVAEDAKATDLLVIPTMDLHPGDWNSDVQNMFLTEMQKARAAQKDVPAYCFGMYGMFGRMADPIHFDNFLRRVASLGIHMMHSPYRDYQTQLITDQIMALPK